MLKEKIIKFILFLCAFVSVVVSFAIMLTILIEALKFFQKESLATFLFSSQWAADAAFMNADGTSKQGVCSYSCSTFYFLYLAYKLVFKVLWELDLLWEL